MSHTNLSLKKTESIISHSKFFILAEVVVCSLSSGNYFKLATTIHSEMLHFWQYYFTSLHFFSFSFPLFWLICKGTFHFMNLICCKLWSGKVEQSLQAGQHFQQSARIWTKLRTEWNLLHFGLISEKEIAWLQKATVSGLQSWK